MRLTNTKNLSSVLAFMAGVALLLSASPTPPKLNAQSTAVSAMGAAGSVSLTLDAAHSKIHWTLPSSLHTVHGTFAVTRGMMSFDSASGKAAGEIVVNAKSGESGNDGRDSRMHKEILETTKYPEVVFRPAQIEGKVAPAGTSDVTVRGTLSVHGTDHEVVSQVHAELSGSDWKGTAKFDVPYVDWGIKNPSNFFLKASKVVSIEVEMAGSVQSSH